MQTIYTTSYRLGVRCDNVLDLNEYRRKLGQLVEEESKQPEIEMEPLLWARERENVPAEAQRPRRSHRAARAGAWVMDICASAGVLAMTVAFTMHIL